MAVSTRGMLMVEKIYIVHFSGALGKAQNMHYFNLISGDKNDSGVQ